MTQGLYTAVFLLFFCIHFSRIFKWPLRIDDIEIICSSVTMCCLPFVHPFFTPWTIHDAFLSHTVFWGCCTPSFSDANPDVLISLVQFRDVHLTQLTHWNSDWLFQASLLCAWWYEMWNGGSHFAGSQKVSLRTADTSKGAKWGLHQRMLFDSWVKPCLMLKLPWQFN